MKIKNNFEPYQLFFISGLVMSFLGVGLWTAFQFNLVESFPMSAHANLMITGFLFAYIYGFLMTAVPKMSQTHEARKWEVFVGLAAVWLQGVLAYFAQPSIAYGVAIFQFLFLFFFIARRWRVKKANPPRCHDSFTHWVFAK